MLELNNFQVKDIGFGSQTRWVDGVLEIDHDEVLKAVLQVPFVERAEIEIVKPGESVRIVSVKDVIGPRVKVEGEGVVYPGAHGRSTATVGSGRTNRLGNMVLIGCSPPLIRDGMVGARRSSFEVRMPYHDFIDMSGPGADSPYSPMTNVCLIIEPGKQFLEDQGQSNRILQRAMLRVNDILAQTTVGRKPTDSEVFDMTPKKNLPGYVYVHNTMGAQPGRSYGGTGVYGVSQLSAPWLISPTEMLDGAVYGAAGGWVTWPITDTIVPHMCRRHGIDFNFLGCIMVKTNWQQQSDKQLMANRAAQMAKMLGADGAIVTPTLRGQRFVETILGIQALEKAGIKTVFIVEEEDNEHGNATPLLTTTH